MPHPQYRVTDIHYRTITTVWIGRDAFSIICDTMAREVGCDPDDFHFEDEMDKDNNWTGDQLIYARGEVVGRLIGMSE